MKTAAIVPAYNEEQTISGVVRTLLRSSKIDEVFVVSDGSEDRTALRAKRCGAKVIELAENVGKGGAMKAGVDAVTADVLLFIDADLLGLTQRHINQLLDPIYDGTADMTVGVFEEGRLATDLAQKIAPFLSGQRAVKRALFSAIPEVEHSRYGVEMALSRYADKQDLPVTVVNLKDLSQIMKEEKEGVARGLWSRVKMYWEILRTIKL